MSGSFYPSLDTIITETSNGLLEKPTEAGRLSEVNSDFSTEETEYDPSLSETPLTVLVTSDMSKHSWVKDENNNVYPAYEYALGTGRPIHHPPTS